MKHIWRYSLILSAVAIITATVSLVKPMPVPIPASPPPPPSADATPLIPSSEQKTGEQKTVPVAMPDTLSIVAAAKSEKTLEPILTDIGISGAMSKLLIESGGGTKFDCHQEAHWIGRIGYKIEGEKAFSSCTADCHSGCYHGAMETFLHKEGTANLAASIDRICSKFATSFGRFECLHGVGHGVLAYLDYDLPDGLKTCASLSDGFSTNSCYGGMFMENIMTGQGLGADGPGTHQTEWVNKTDPFFPCDKVSDDYDVQYQCYQMQTSWMLYIANYDFKTVAAQCLQVTEKMRPVCFKSFGRDAAGHTLRNPDKIVALCENVPREKDYYNQCVIGAVNVIVDFWGPALKGQASELCGKIPDEQGKKICYQTLVGRLSGLFSSPEGRKAVCDTFEPTYINLCKGV